MRLVQFITEDNRRHVGAVEENGDALRVVKKATSVYDLALEADKQKTKLETLVRDRLDNKTVDYAQVITDKRLFPPLDHPDPAHCHVSGTGLTHLGSAEARNKMHVKKDKDVAEPLTDSMRMFQWGLEGGKAKLQWKPPNSLSSTSFSKTSLLRVS